VQLATAYISLNVRTDDIKKQVSSALNGVGREGRRAGTAVGSNMMAGIRDHLGGSRVTSLFNPMEIAGVRWAVKAGATIGRALRTAIVSGVTAGVGAALLGAGAVLAAGLDRLKTLQRAEVQLSLKLSPSEIKQVKADITKVVEGTPISLDAALQAVPKAINSGLRGKELSQYIKDVADMTAATGGQASFQQLDIILSQIRSKSKLTGEEMAQLIDAGVDVRGMLKETFNWDDKTLNRMLKNNKVGITELQKATQQLYGQNGGLAKKMGETFDGAIGNLKASAARLGANVLDVVFGGGESGDPLEGAVDGVTALTEKLNTAGKWVADNKDEIRGYFNGARDTAVSLTDKVKGLVQWLKDAWRAGEELGSKISSGFDKAKTTINNWWTSASDKLGRMKTKIGDIFDDLKKKFDGVFGADGWIAQQFNKVAETINKVREVLGLGPATANAASPSAGSPGSPGSAGSTGSTGSSGSSGSFNPGPMAPNAFGNFPGRAGLAPGTPLDGSDQSIVGGDLSGAMAQANAQDAAKPRKVGSDKGLLPATVELKDYLAGQFPEISDIGGYRDTDYTPFGVINEHSSGKAIDIMVPKNYMDPETGRPTAAGLAWGDRVMREALAKGASVLWKQTQFDPNGNTSGMPDRGDNVQNHWDHLHVLEGSYANFAAGGRVMGAGNGTSDSIPAMLSNGEHVLTAADVKRMGGQDSVYGFRQALQAGIIPGFNTGGGVDPTIIQNTNDEIADLGNQLAQNKLQWEEVNNPDSDASDAEKIKVRQELERTTRLLNQAQAAAPIIAAGGTPPDMSGQNRVFDLTDQLDQAVRNQKELQESGEATDLQMLQAQYGVTQTKREREQAIAALQGQSGGTDYGQEFVRSLGFIPASAGNTGVAGTSSLAGFIGMGNEVVGGLIDTGTNLAQMAVSAAITGAAAAGTFGAAAPAAPAASAAAGYGIQLLGNTAKRLSSYGFQMAGIGADALMEQMSPFGMPRWLGYDYGNFMPQIGIQEAALSTVEQMGSDAIKKQMGGPGQQPVVPADPSAGVNMAPSGPAAGAAVPAPPAPVPVTPNQSILQPGDPGFYTPPPVFDLSNPTGAGGWGGGGSWAQGGHVGVYDNGGVLNPGELAFNASRTPESILTKQQWNAMAATASTQGERQGPLVENLYAQDMQDAIRQLEKTKRRDMMQYSGRP
jgi:hypothetical protein